MTLTSEERDEIVRLRLDGMTVRAVAKETGHAPNTVTRAWRLHMEESATVRRDDLDVQREEIVLRLEQAAWEAREAGHQAREAGDRVGHVRYLREERDALREIARLTLPDRMPPSPPPPVERMHPAEERELLKARLIEYCEEYNARDPATEPVTIDDPNDPRVLLGNHVVGLLEEGSHQHPQPEWRIIPEDPSAVA